MSNSGSGRDREPRPAGDQAGPSAKTDDLKEGSQKTLTAAQIRLKERTRRLVGRKSSSSTAKKKKSGGAGRRSKAKNETPSSSATKKAKPIQKGKSYRTRAEPKEKDPESQEVKNKKFVFDTKNGGRSQGGEFLFRFFKILQYIFALLSLEAAEKFSSWI